MTTVREVLFDSPADEAKAAETMAAAMTVSDVPPGEAASVVLAKIAAQLEFEVGDVLIQAWKARSALANACRQTLADPGTVRRVKVAVYALPWDYELDFDLKLSGKTVATVTAGVGLELEVTGLNATVQRGRIVKIDGGQYKVVATLQLQTLPVLSRERMFSLPYELKVGDGIALT